MSKKIYTKLTAYKGTLVVEHQVTESDDIVVTPYDRPGNMGYVVKDVSYVGVSQEAYDFLKSLPKGSDSLGEVDMFRTSDGQHCLAILGGACVLIGKDAETSRDYDVPPLSAFQLIENEVPEGAIHAIDGE